MAENHQVTLPILGMTCANCVATVERSLSKTEGVEEASVNLSSERAAVRYDPDQTSVKELVEQVRKVGYDVAIGEAALQIQNLSDQADALRLEKALNSLEGVLFSQANLATERVTVRYVPTIISQSEIRQAIARLVLRLLKNQPKAKMPKPLHAKRDRTPTAHAGHPR